MKNFIQHEKQRLEKLQNILDTIEYAEIKIRNYEGFFSKWGIFGVTAKSHHQNEITKMAKARLENYYLNTLKS